jgi:hypothetical protein
MTAPRRRTGSVSAGGRKDHAGTRAGIDCRSGFGAQRLPGTPHRPRGCGCCAGAQHAEAGGVDRRDRRDGDRLRRHPGGSISSSIMPAAGRAARSPSSIPRRSPTAISTCIASSAAPGSAKSSCARGSRRSEAKLPRGRARPGHPRLERRIWR